MTQETLEISRNAISLKLHLIIAKYLNQIQQFALNCLINSFLHLKNHYLKHCLQSQLVNKNIFEMFLPKNTDNRLNLISAFEFRDINLVNKVLSYNIKLVFINQNSQNGTALCIAVKNEDIEIIKQLLLVPGINAEIADENGLTPLILCIEKMNIQMLSLFIDYYGENNREQFWQIQQSIDVLYDTFLNYKHQKYQASHAKK